MQKFKEYILQGIGISIGFIITSVLCGIILVIAIFIKAGYLEASERYQAYSYRKANEKLEREAIKQAQIKEAEREAKQKQAQIEKAEREAKEIQQKIEEVRNKENDRKNKLPNFENINLDEIELRELSLSNDELELLKNRGIKINKIGCYSIEVKSGIGDVTIYDVIDMKQVTTIAYVNKNKESKFIGEYGYIVVAQDGVDIECIYQE